MSLVRLLPETLGLGTPCTLCLQKPDMEGRLQQPDALDIRITTKNLLQFFKVVLLLQKLYNSYCVFFLVTTPTYFPCLPPPKKKRCNLISFLELHLLVILEIIRWLILTASLQWTQFVPNILSIYLLWSVYIYIYIFCWRRKEGKRRGAVWWEAY